MAYILYTTYTKYKDIDLSDINGNLISIISCHMFLFIIQVVLYYNQFMIIRGGQVVLLIRKVVYISSLSVVLNGFVIVII